MPTIAENAEGASALAAVLAAGLDEISASQTITFTKYVKVTLPLDGFVFWLRSDLVGAEALQNATQIGPVPVSPLATFDAPGSLHFTSDRRQSEDETITVNRVVFTAKQEIQPFNEISPVVMFVGIFRGVRFAFAQRRSYYQQADLHHYMGDAVYPALASQIVDSVEALDTAHQVVSNSLPVWLSLNRIVRVFPAFLVPDNLPPPYAVAQVVAGTQRALQATPYVDGSGSRWQLVAERVKITLYGLRNDQALDYIAMVERYSLDSENIGIMNMPVLRDEIRTQVELAAIATKKVVEFEVNYHQARVNSIARQLIEVVVPTFAVTSVPRPAPTFTATTEGHSIDGPGDPQQAANPADTVIIGADASIQPAGA